MSDELIPIEPIVEEPAEFTPMADEIVQAALKQVRSHSFSKRNPHLGKMINCQIHGFRHRANEFKCEQKFTHVIDGYEVFREDPEKGTLVPDLRTAVPVDERPTQKQILGAAAFAKKRFNPHPSKIKLQFIERTRKVFEDMEFELDKKDPNFEKNLHRARVEAARQLRAERRASRRVRASFTNRSRRVNRGLL